MNTTDLNEISERLKTEYNKNLLKLNKLDSKIKLKNNNSFSSRFKSLLISFLMGFLVYLGLSSFIPINSLLLTSYLIPILTILLRKRNRDTLKMLFNEKFAINEEETIKLEQEREKTLSLNRVLELTIRNIKMSKELNLKDEVNLNYQNLNLEYQSLESDLDKLVTNSILNKVRKKMTKLKKSNLKLLGILSGLVFSLPTLFLLKDITIISYIYLILSAFLGFKVTSLYSKKVLSSYQDILNKYEDTYVSESLNTKIVELANLKFNLEVAKEKDMKSEKNSKEEIKSDVSHNYEYEQEPINKETIKSHHLIR